MNQNWDLKFHTLKITLKILKLFGVENHFIQVNGFLRNQFQGNIQKCDFSKINFDLVSFKRSFSKKFSYTTTYSQKPIKNTLMSFSPFENVTDKFKYNWSFQKLKKSSKLLWIFQQQAWYFHKETEKILSLSKIDQKLIGFIYLME